MSIEKLKEKAKEVVGAKWVFDDPVDRYPYGRDIVTDGLKRYTEMLPEFVVFPGSTQEIQKIVRLANYYKIPLFIIGAGSTLLVGSIPTQKGITLDFKRMQGVELDYENLTVSVEAGVSALPLSGEFKKLVREKGVRFRPYFGGGPGPSSHNATNILTGQNKLAGYKYSMGIYCVNAVEMVLPDGSLLKTSAIADEKSKGSFWHHGPGPDLTYLPFFANAAYGIATKIIWKLYPIPDHYLSVWAYYADFKAPLKAVRELMRREIGKGLCIIDLWTHSAYSSETIEESRLLAKLAPKIFLGLSIEGTERMVSYQKKEATRIIEESGGRIAPRELVEVYRGHEVNSAGWQQSNSPRILKHLGRTLAAGTYLAVNVYEEFDDKIMKILRDLESELDGYWNHPEPGFGEYAGGPQTYLCQWGHANGAVEYIFAWDHRSKKNTEDMIKIAREIKRVPDEMGAGPLVLGRDPSLPHLMGTNYQLSRRLKEMLDPLNIMSPGIAFLD
jgi:glycolate oxidase